MWNTISFPRLAKDVFADLNERSLGLPGTEANFPLSRAQRKDISGGQVGKGEAL